MCINQLHSHRRPRRHGVIYVAVLGAALIIAVVALSAIHLTRVELDGVTSADRIARAELMAQAGIEYALARIKSDTSWRTNYVHNQQNPSAAWYAGAGQDGFKFILQDDDSNLSDDIRDPVRLVGLGRCGDATAAIAVRLEPTNQGLTSLGMSLHSAGAFTNSKDVIVDRMLGSNQSINVTGDKINGDAWCTGGISGSVTGNKYNNASPAKTMPDVANSLEYYLANGTPIDINSIPSATISKQVLTPYYNPYGAVNSQGIYIIDCKSQQLTIADSRIEATLVVTGVAAALPVIITNNIHWEPPFKNFPALLVQGNCSMSWHGDQGLVESTEGMNYNPPAAPYMNFSDADQTDVYSGLMKGLVYVSGNLSISKQAIFEGTVVVGGNTSISDITTVTFNSVHKNYPPPGFSEGAQMRIVPGTWRRIAAP